MPRRRDRPLRFHPSIRPNPMHNPVFANWIDRCFGTEARLSLASAAFSLRHCAVTEGAH